MWLRLNRWLQQSKRGRGRLLPSESKRKIVGSSVEEALKKKLLVVGHAATKRAKV